MKVVGCLLLAAAAAGLEDIPANRSLLNSRRLAEGRRLATVKCEVEAYPFAFGKTAPYNEATNTHSCTASKPAVVVAADGTVDDTGGDSDIQSACCKAAPLCSTSYVNHGATPGANQAACETTGNVVPADLSCFTTDGATSAKCSAVETDFTTAIDKVHCCRQMCNDATGGFETDAASTTKPDCPATGGTFRVATHATAYCATGACAASDQATCCQKKCKDGFQLFDVDLVTADGNDRNCPEGADLVSTTEYCTGSTCGSGDDNTCCQKKCTSGYELFGGTTDGKRQCGEGQQVNPDDYCSGPTCKSGDDKTCCETKCDAAGAGFELHGGSTAGMSQCAKDLRVHPTEYCLGQDCGKSSSVCCQQKCSAGFKLKGATGTGKECAKDQTVHATAYCKGAACATADAGVCCQDTCKTGFKLNGATTDEPVTCPHSEVDSIASDAKCAGSPCVAADSKICCNEKCTDKKVGFKVYKGTGKEPFECANGEMVVAQGICKGACDDDDAGVCCMKKNNSTTATTDAQSSGLTLLAAGLVFIVAASS